MDAFLQTLRNLGPARLGAIGAIGVILVGLFLYLITRAADQPMGLLYGELELGDSGQIAAELESQGVPFQIAAGGASILVPADQVDRMRLAMAQQGLPKGGSLGYEIFDRADAFGTTSFVQNINRLRALEGELARTIGTIGGVRQARVHLVLPERELFSRDQQQPSASVFLRLAGTGLSAEQISAIQHLVGAAVPRLQPGDVSIVDDRGNLLARGQQGDGADLMAMNAEAIRAAHERRLTQTVEELLSRTVGYGRVRAQVSVEMDFDRVTISAETYDPNSQVARSTQFVTDEQRRADGAGIDPVTVATALPEADAADPAGALGGASDESKRTEETTNFEISRVIENTVRDTGVIRRLSVAVLVDGIYQPDAEGVPVYAPRTETELTQFEALVRSAVGFDGRRGDTVEIVNMPFVADGTASPEEPARLLLGLGSEDLFRIAELLVLGMVAVLVILLVVRPLLTRLLDTSRQRAGAGGEDPTLLGADAVTRALAGPDGATGTPLLAAPVADGSPASEIDALINIHQVEGRVRASSLRKVGEIVEKHPEEAVSIIRNWMYQDA